MVAGRHNLTRRALLGAGVGVCATPAAGARSAFVPSEVEGRSSRPAPAKKDALRPAQDEGDSEEQSRRRWTRALAAYRRAEARVAACLAAESALPPERRAYPACEELEEEHGRLDSLRTRALTRLLALPAPDLPALALKLELAVADLAWELAGCEHCLAVAAADARRLAGGAGDPRRRFS